MLLGGGGRRDRSTSSNELETVDPVASVKELGGAELSKGRPNGYSSLSCCGFRGGDGTALLERVRSSKARFRGVVKVEDEIEGEGMDETGAESS